MKKIKFATILLVLCNVAFAQNSTNNIYVVLEQYMALADSMPSYTNPIIRIVEGDSRAFIDNMTPYLEISRTELKNLDSIIEWANSFAHNSENANERTLAYSIFDSFLIIERSKNSQLNLDLPTKQKLVSYILNLSNTTTKNVLSAMRYHSEPDYFNDASRERIRLLLSDSLPPAEMEVIGKRHLALVMSSSPDTTNVRVIQEHVRYISSTGDSLSMAEWLSQRFNRGLKRYLAGYSTINGNLISLIGNAYLHEFSERLEEIYHDDSYRINRREIELVLARLQYKDFEDKVLNRIRRELNEDEKRILSLEKELFYINTKRTLLVYAEFLRSNFDISCQYAHDRSIRGGYAYNVFLNLRRIIKDMPHRELITEAAKSNAYPPFWEEGVLWSFCDIIEFVPESILDETYDWIQENKDNLELNPEFSTTR